MKKTYALFGIILLFITNIWLCSTSTVIIRFASEKEYYIVLPDCPATYVKLTLTHREPGYTYVQEHKIKLMEIPENRTITYKTTVQKLNYIGIYAEFYNESLNGYMKVGTEAFSLDF